MDASLLLNPTKQPCTQRIDTALKISFEADESMYYSNIFEFVFETFKMIKGQVPFL